MADVYDGYGVIVWFATSSAPRCIGRVASLAAAERAAREYLGADARGVWIERPDGSREVVR